VDPGVDCLSFHQSQKLNQLFAQYRSEIFKVFEPSLSRGASEKMEAEGLKSPTAPTAKTDEKPKQEPAPGTTPPAPATPERAPASVSPSTQAPEPVRVHVVARGESLKSISNHYYKTESLWNEIMKANPSIKNPSQVGVGQKLRIPELSQEQIKAKKGEGQ
jgi:nucleoid-associated protein YgaU